MKLTFVETAVFSARWHRRQDGEALRALQNLLLESPERGDPIPGCGILRKVRFGDVSRSQGKRGGLRVIYLYTPEARQIDLITVYGKDEADDLSKSDTRLFCQLAKMIRAAAAAQAAKPGREPKP